MRAWQVQGKGEPRDVLHAVEIEPPEPGPGQVRVRVLAAGVGLPDVLMCRGVYPLTPPLPFTPGQELAGVVTAVGPGVDLPIGTTIMSTSVFVEGHGSYAEESLAYAGHSYAVPEGLDHAGAAGFWIPHMTAWIGLVDRGRIGEGDRLVVLGAAGGSGIAAVQLGAALGARVTAVASDERKAAFCLGLGAHEAVVGSVVATAGDGSGEVPLADELRRRTGGRGVDAIYDPVGGAPAEAAFPALARDGRLLMVGFASGRWPQIHAHDAVIANTALVGVFAGGYSREHLDGIHAGLSALIADGRLRNAVTERVPFDGLRDALQRLADRSIIGKLVMEPPA